MMHLICRRVSVLLFLAVNGRQEYVTVCCMPFSELSYFVSELVS